MDNCCFAGFELSAVVMTCCGYGRAALCQDEEEVRFPRDMLHLAAFRKRKAQSGRSFVNPTQVPAPAPPQLQLTL